MSINILHKGDDDDDDDDNNNVIIITKSKYIPQNSNCGLICLWDEVEKSHMGWKYRKL